MPLARRSAMEVRASGNAHAIVEIRGQLELRHTMTLVLEYDHESGEEDLELDAQELAELIVWARKKRRDEIRAEETEAGKT